MGTIKDRNGTDLTEAEDMKNRKKVKACSCVRLFGTMWTVAYQSLVVLQARILKWIARDKNTQKNYTKKIITTQIITMV